MKKLMLMLGLAAMTAMSGCATISDTSQKVGHALGVSSDKGSAATGGAVMGCGAGVVVGALLHKNVLAGCAVGAAAGALTGVAAYDAQLKKARELQADLNATGKARAPVVETTTVTVQEEQEDGTKVPKATPAFKALPVHLDAADVNARGQGTVAVLQKAVAWAKADKGTQAITITASAGPKGRAWLVSELTTAAAGNPHVIIKDVAGSATDPQIIIAPVPDVR